MEGGGVGGGVGAVIAIFLSSCCLGLLVLDEMFPVNILNFL
jgi:hypothetical protein